MPSLLRHFQLHLTPAKVPRLAAILLAVLLAGCQTTGPHPGEAPGSDTDRAVGIDNESTWLEDEKDEPDDIWQRMRDGFKLQNEIGFNPRIERQRLWFVSNPSFLQSASDRGSLYIHYVVEQLQRHNMPLELALLPVIESAYNPMAYSRSHAVGIWQFIPATGRNFNLQQTAWYDGRRDILASTNAAISYLSRLNQMFNGDWLLSLAAYNAGEGTVSRAIERNQRLGLPTDYWNLQLPKETQDYVPKLLALSQIVMAPEAYGIDLHPIANEPYFEVVNLKQERLDLGRLADLVDMEKEEILQLNPAFKRGITYGGPKRLLVPSDKAEMLEANLALMKPQDPVDWQTYKVKAGDSLHGIANRYRVTVNTLKDINQLRGNNLSIGQTLSIPTEPGMKFNEPLFQRSSAPAASRSYSVRKGDNLWSIAKSQGVKVNDLKRWNNLRSNDLKLGQQLKLQASSAASQSTASARKNNNGGRQQVTYYKVKTGDSLYLIAKRFKVDLKQLQRWNPKASKHLKPGQSLALYL